jgi:hypothetical protein
MVVLKRLGLLLMLATCKPNLGSPLALVTGPELLAARSTPAEGAPGDTIAYDALFVDTSGERGDALDWAYCTARKPLDQLDTFSFDCLAASGPNIAELGAAPTVTGMMPSDACRNFGPEVPPSQPGQPQGRPVDPDTTGGYYQPLRVISAAETDIASTRIACGVAGASLDDSATFQARYNNNQNPSVLDVTSSSGSLSQNTAMPTVMATGAYVTLTASWPACPLMDVCGDGICGADESRTTCPADCTTPVGCAGSERYVVYDTTQRAIVVARETMRVSWFITGGAFDSDATGRDGTDTTTTTSNGLTLPTTPGALHGWVVVRDDRGGVGWRRFEIAAQ